MCFAIQTDEKATAFDRVIILLVTGGQSKLHGIRPCGIYPVEEKMVCIFLRTDTVSSYSRW